MTVLVATGPGVSGGETAVEGVGALLSLVAGPPMGRFAEPVEDDPETMGWGGCGLVVLNEPEVLEEGTGAPLAVGWAREVALPVGKGAEGADSVIEAVEGAANDVALPDGEGAAEGMDLEIEAVEGAADDVAAVEVIGDEVG